MQPVIYEEDTLRQPGNRRQQHGGHGPARQRRGTAAGNGHRRLYQAAWPVSPIWPTTRPRPWHSSSPTAPSIPAASSDIVVATRQRPASWIVSQQPSATAIGRAALLNSAGGRGRGSVWQPRDQRQLHRGDRDAEQRYGPASGNHNRHRDGRRGRLHEPRRQHGPDARAPVRSRRLDLLAHELDRRQPRGAEQAGRAHAAVGDGAGAAAV